MAWVKVDVGFFRNPKIMGIGGSAKALYLAGLCYAGGSLTDGFIPESAPRSLAAEADITGSPKAIKQLIAAGLWEVVDGGYQIHDYLDYNQSADKVQANKDAAKGRMQRSRSQNVRANNERSSREVREPDTDTDTDTELTDSNESDARAKNHSPVSKRFNEFWLAYPRKVGKGDAIKAFGRIRWSEVDFAELMAALARQKASEQWTRENGRFVPNPATWLNQGRWEDELKPAGNGATLRDEATDYSAPDWLNVQEF